MYYEDGGVGWNFRVVLELRNIFRVMVACEIRRYHSWVGYLGSVEHRPAIKWSLKAWMDLSAEFWQWIFCGILANEYVGEQAVNRSFD